jgi:hypothetical protein
MADLCNTTSPQIKHANGVGNPPFIRIFHKSIRSFKRILDKMTDRIRPFVSITMDIKAKRIIIRSPRFIGSMLKMIRKVRRQAKVRIDEEFKVYLVENSLDLICLKWWICMNHLSNSPNSWSSYFQIKPSSLIEISKTTWSSSMRVIVSID